MFNAPNVKLQHFFRGHGDLSKDQGSNAILATMCMVVSLSTLAQIFDETLPIINKSRHPKKGEYKEQNERTHIQEDKRTTFEAEPQRQISCI
jgi:hypothetical protein